MKKVSFKIRSNNQPFPTEALENWGVEVKLVEKNPVRSIYELTLWVEEGQELSTVFKLGQLSILDQKIVRK